MDEAPAAIALRAVHQELENVTVERDRARFERVSALNAFIAGARQHVPGDIRLTPHRGRAVVAGRRSGASPYDYDLATYDTGDTFDQSPAKGFVALWGLPSKIAARRDRKVG